MISDEMRELLSTYVDGELKDSDAVRVEEMSKRDPELRREIDAYCILRRRLQEWDAEDNAEAPTPGVKRRALARVHAYVALTRPRAVYGGTWAVAAGLLVALGLGVLLARKGTSGDTIRLSAERALSPAPAPVAPLASHRVASEPLTLRNMEPASEYTPIHPVLKDGLRGWWIDGQVWTRNSINKAIRWAEEREQLRAYQARHPERPETRTGAFRPEIMMLVRGYEPAAVPFESLVLLRHQPELGVPAATAMPVDGDVGRDQSDPADRLIIETGKLPRGVSRLLLAGEVFVGSKDGSGRVRLVGASSWVMDSSAIPMVKADEVAIPADAARLVLQKTMLGPNARRALVSGNVPRIDPKQLAVNRDSEVERLMQPLRADAGATGFAVVVGRKIAGVELFGSHELLIELAPRLLRGYLLEAGRKRIRLHVPTRGIDDIKKLASVFVGRVSESAIKLADVKGGSTDEWPEGLRRINIMAGPNKIAGHGLLYAGRPLHVTIFGEP